MTTLNLNNEDQVKHQMQSNASEKKQLNSQQEPEGSDQNSTEGKMIKKCSIALLAIAIVKILFAEVSGLVTIIGKFFN